MASQDKNPPLGLVKRTVSISPDIISPCEVCSQPLGDSNRFLIHDQINHYFTHGYRLLHVGQQTTWDTHERPWQTTVAVLGKE